MESDKLMIVVNGCVFSSDAHDRGMGRYVRFIIQTIAVSGFKICLILYKNSRLVEDDPLKSFLSKIEYIDIDPAVYSEQDIHINSFEIETIIRKNNGFAFIDATPFFLPMRLDITQCAVVAIAYDLIPMKYPNDYLQHQIVHDIYCNGLRRLTNADHILAISNQAKEDLFHYLGIKKERIEVIYPSLNKNYLTHQCIEKKSKDFFSIVGGHCSKNPKFALELFNRLNILKNRNFLICVPTKSQLNSLQIEFPQLIKPLLLHSNLKEEDKISYQAQANIVFHLSKEEGFGIPLLEALFMHSKVVCCDITVNREILEKGGKEWDQIALLISTQIEDVNIPKISDFFDKPMPNENFQYFENIKNYFLFHWETEALEIIKNVIKQAHKNHNMFLGNVVAKMACNLPANFCGVADYAYSIPHGTKKNMLIYTADLTTKEVSGLETVRIKSHLCFSGDLETDVPTIFHLAVSERLWFGIELIRLYGTSKDIVILHDHVYLYGLYHLYLYYKDLSQFLEDYFIDSDASLRDLLSKTKKMNFDKFQLTLKEYKSAWLRQKKVQLISHLTEAAEKEYALYSNKTSSFDKKYIEIGIDDRASPLILRIGTSWRIQKGFSNSDFLVGVFGSVTDNKLLFEIASAVSSANKIIQSKCINLNIHFIICGIVCDLPLFQRMKDLFYNQGLQSLFHYENPQSDQAFDGVISAMNLVISCRKQNRGQLSHIIPRALSLGKPILTNAKSGYTMIRRDFIIDNEEFENRLAEKLCHLFQNREPLESVSEYNRQLFLEKHHITHFFDQIITKQSGAFHEIQQSN